MAIKAGTHRGNLDTAPESLRKRGRLDARVVWGFVEDVVAGEIADERFVNAPSFARIQV